MNDFIQFLGEPLAQRSLWACAFIGFTNGFVSALVVLRRSALQIGTLSCALLPGIALAILLFGLLQVSILLGAVLAALLVGLGSLFVSRTARVEHDTALSVLHTAAFAAGYVILIQLGLQQKVDDWLFGNIMSMTDTDLWVAYATGAVAMLGITALFRPLVIFLFDPRAAATMGLPARAYNYGIFALVLIVIATPGLLVLLSALSNFFHLLISSIMMRRREYTLRRAHGAHTRDLWLMFSTQVIVTMLIVGFVSMLVVELCSPIFSLKMSQINQFVLDRPEMLRQNASLLTIKQDPFVL